EFCNNIVQINELNPSEERDAVFSFDAKRIPGTPKDTLKFLITDNKGNRWNKEVVIQYSLPTEFKLAQNYPNPFNPSTTIEFTVPQNGRYNLSVYNVLGQLVNVLADDEYPTGYYKVTFDANRLARGMYIYKLSGNNINIVKKMLLVK
ncbi:MAG: T9SS type A sorting domain-containing protein, partial [Bacteroidota bacterium]